VPDGFLWGGEKTLDRNTTQKSRTPQKGPRGLDHIKVYGETGNLSWKYTHKKERQIETGADWGLLSRLSGEKGR